MNHISLEIEIPNNLNQISKNEIFHLILTLPHEEILITPTQNSAIHCYTIYDNNLSYTIETYLDKYISKKVRYNILIYKDKETRDDETKEKTMRISNRHVDHFKTDYSLDATDNPIKLAYADLKTSSQLSNVKDA